MTKQITVASHAEITIKRPGGNVEIVTWTGGVELTAGLFNRIQKANKDAGKGDVLGYRNITKTVDMPVEWAAASTAERAYDTHVASVYSAMDHKE